MADDVKARLAALVAESSIRRVKVVAWRDLDDPEAGGSELHAAEVLRRWAAAGVDITQRTSAVGGLPRLSRRDGYTVIRENGRYGVFAHVFREGRRRASKEFDAVVEIWNGMPFFSPLWFHKRRSVWLHHVHGEMWQMTLPGLLGRIGWFVEHRLAPLMYRRTDIVTLSHSSEEEIHERLGLQRTHVVGPGISDFYSPGSRKSEEPLVVAVGRLVPVKRFDLLINEFVRVREAVPTARLVIAGEGYLRHDLEEQIDRLGADSYITLAGRVSDTELREMYRAAWVVTSASLREGWGMSLTEAAACGTPSVASDIAGHRDSVSVGRSGLLVPDAEIGATISMLLTNDNDRNALTRGALEYAGELSWDHTALRLFQLLVDA